MVMLKTMGYTFLEKENLPEALKNKPKWVSCLALTSGFLIITLSAVTIGAIFGYTYCYIEHRGIRPGNYNYTQPTLQISHPYKGEYNMTINGALLSSVSRILKIGHALLDNAIGCNDSNDTNTKTV